MEASLSLLAVGISAAAVMFAYRLWEIQKGRANADKDRRSQKMPIEVLIEKSGTLTAYFKLGWSLAKVHVRQTARRTREMFSNSRGFIRFRNLIHGKYHTPADRRPSPFLQDVVEHKEALSREEYSEQRR